MSLGSGIVGNAHEFNGKGYFSYDLGPTELSVSTLEFWIRTSQEKTMLIAVDGGEYQVRLEGKKLVFEFDAPFNTSGSALSLTSTKGIADDQAHHIALTVGHGADRNVRLYVDGKLDQSVGEVSLGEEVSRGEATAEEGDRGEKLDCSGGESSASR